MVLLRCAWHKRYFGYPWVYDVISWRGRDLTFSDGMCLRCARRWRASLREIYDESAARSTPLVPVWFWRAALAGVLLVTLLLAARSLNHADTKVHSTPPNASPPIAWQAEAERLAGREAALPRAAAPAHDRAAARERATADAAVTEPEAVTAANAEPSERPQDPGVVDPLSRRRPTAVAQHSPRDHSSAHPMTAVTRCCSQAWLTSIAFVSGPGRPARPMSLQAP